MSNSISGIGGGNAMMMQMRTMKRPDPTEMAANLFAQLDTAGQGYLQKSDLQTAFDKISSTTSASSSDPTPSVDIDTLFSKLDSNGDGKVSKQEFSDTLKKVAEQLDQQFMNKRLQGGEMSGAGGMPPPPPPSGGGNDAGFTKDELTSQLQEIGTSDSKRSSLISSIVANFDKADTDGDGKVSMKEAMAYDQTLQSASASSSTSSASSASSTTATATSGESGATTAVGSDLSAELVRQIMQLMQAYRPDQVALKTSSLSVSA